MGGSVNMVGSINNNAGKPVIFKRPAMTIKQDFFVIGVSISNKHVKRLATYPEYIQDILLDKIREACEIYAFDSIRVDKFSKVKGTDFFKITPEFLVECVEDTVLDLTDLPKKLSDFNKRQRIAGQGQGDLFPKMTVIKKGPSPAKHSKPNIISGIANPLSENLLLDPAKLVKEYPYPQKPVEYRNLLQFITHGTGVFPGDQEALTPYDYFSRRDVRARGVSMYSLRSGNKDFIAVFLNPRTHALQFRNRLIFDADLVSQAATYGAIGKTGCSYDRVSYYENRFFDSDVVGFIYYGDMPVSFATVSQMDVLVKDHGPLTFGFIHFVMSLGEFQSRGFTSYLATEILSRMYFLNAWRNEKANLFINEKGRLVSNRFAMWCLCHTGRIPAGHQFLSRFSITDPRISRSGELVKLMVETADHGLYGDRGDRQLVPVTPFAWRDEAVYPPENRYPTDSEGNVFIPEREKALYTYPQILEILGGEEGIKKGNGAYYIGLITFDRVRASKKMNKRKVSGVGQVESFGDRIRGSLIKSLI